MKLAPKPLDVVNFLKREGISVAEICVYEYGVASRNFHAM